MIDMQNDELCITMSKILEAVIMKSTLDGKSFPLTSASNFLAKSKYEGLMQYYREIEDSIPIDVEYVRFRVLGKDYEVLGQVLSDIVGTITHYENVQQKFFLPDIIQIAKNTLINILNDSQMFAWACQFDYDILKQIDQLTKNLDISQEKKIQNIQPREIQHFLYCLETLTDDQIDELNKTLKYFGIKTNNLNEVEINKICPQKIRQMTEHLRKYTLSRIQNERVNARIEYWEDIIKQTIDYKYKFEKQELILQYALPPKFIQQPEQYLSEYLLDQMLLKPFKDQKLLMAYNIIKINPIAKISQYQSELLVQAHITVLLMDLDQIILAEVSKTTEQNIFVKINGVLDGKLIIDDKEQIQYYKKQDILRCEVVNKEISKNKIYYIIKPICKVLDANQEEQ